MARPADFQRGSAETRRVCTPLPYALASRNCFLPAVALLALTGPLDACLPRTPKIPMLSRAVTTTCPAPDAGVLKKLLFGVGVGFDRFGGAQGMGISRVMPDSPASRAGLTVGCMILEINGVATTGRSGEECARIIQNVSGPVSMKILDSEQREKSLKLNKAWLPISESVLPYAP